MNDVDILTEAILGSIEDQDNDVIWWMKFLIATIASIQSKSDVEKAVDKLQDLSLLSFYGNEIRSLTLKIETFLMKEWTEN